MKARKRNSLEIIEDLRSRNHKLTVANKRLAGKNCFLSVKLNVAMRRIELLKAELCKPKWWQFWRRA